MTKVQIRYRGYIIKTHTGGGKKYLIISPHHMDGAWTVDSIDEAKKTIDDNEEGYEQNNPSLHPSTIMDYVRRGKFSKLSYEQLQEAQNYAGVAGLTHTQTMRLDAEVDKRRYSGRNPRHAPVTAAKARKILHDGHIYGVPITEKQRRYFGAIASGYPLRNVVPVFGAVAKWLPHAVGNPYRVSTRRVYSVKGRYASKRKTVKTRKQALAMAKNPKGLTKIYGKVTRIEATKTGKHKCDAACKAAGHRYFHDFETSPSMYGTPDHKGLIIK